MIEYISLLLEGCCFVMILNKYHQDIFRVNIRTLLLLLIDVGILFLINKYSFPVILELGICFAAVVYVHIEYKERYIKAVISVLVSLVILGIIQLFVGNLVNILLNYIGDVVIKGTVINGSAFILLLILGIGGKAAETPEQRSSFLKVVSIYIIIVFLSMIAIYKLRRYLSFTECALLAAMVILAMLLVSAWKRERLLNIEKDKRLYLQNLYDLSYDTLLSDVRNRQHEFQNHLAAIKGLSYTCRTYEELVSHQRQYCDFMVEENKYNKLIYACRNPVLNGFLYHKFKEAEEHQGVEIEFRIAMDGQGKEKLEIFDLIEMIGVVFDNAVEAMEHEKMKKLKFHLLETDSDIQIEIMNISRKIADKEIEKFFRKGYTTKGSGRGVGLKKLQQLKNKYHGKIEVGNVEADDRNYFMFRIIL